MRRHRCSAAGRRQPGDPGQAFADYVRVLTAWRRLPFLDPGLPPELLPADWLGARAAALFAESRGRLAGPACDHVLEVAGLPRCRRNRVRGLLAGDLPLFEHVR